jgi:hypothetical protein
MGFCSKLGESPNTWKHFGPKPTQVLNSVISVLLRQETATWRTREELCTVRNSVTLKRIGFFCFPIKHSTRTWGGLNLGSDGFWKGDYGWGGRVRRPFGARGRSSIRYGTRLGDLKENWFLLFSNSTLNTHCALLRHSKWRPHTNTHTHTAVCLAVAGESILQREKQEEVRTHAPDSQTADRGSN